MASSDLIIRTKDYALSVIELFAELPNEPKLKSSGVNCYDPAHPSARNSNNGSRAQRVRDTRSWRGVMRPWSCFRDRDIRGTTMNSLEDLDVFKLNHQLALKTYSATKNVFARRVVQLGRSNAARGGLGGDESDGGGR